MPRHRGASQAVSGDVEVVLYTDGACSGNPGPGGWAFILEHQSSGRTLEDSGAEWQTTNNRMELQAVIQGLSRMTRPSRIHVVTDSSYVQQGATDWIYKWKARGWKRKTASGKKPVKNQDLWEQLDRIRNRHEVSFERVRGHAGHPMNERCDQLAVAAYQRLKKSRP